MARPAGVRRVTRPNLTPQEQKALKALDAYIAAHGWAPTVDELRRLLGLASKSWTYHLLLRLEEKGYIQLGHAPRMIRIKPPISPI